MASRKQEPSAGAPQPEREAWEARRAEVAELAYARLLYLLRPAAPLEDCEMACKIGHMLKELGLI